MSVATRRPFTVQFIATSFLALWLIMAAFPFIWTLWGSFKVEGDFFSDANQFRLRHAYLVAGDFIIGQTWTTLTVLEALPNIIDFAAGDALFGGRTAQIRYQKNLNNKYELAIGLEMLARTTNLPRCLVIGILDWTENESRPALFAP